MKCPCGSSSNRSWCGIHPVVRQPAQRVQPLQAEADKLRLLREQCFIQFARFVRDEHRWQPHLAPGLHRGRQFGRHGAQEFPLCPAARFHYVARAMFETITTALTTVDAKLKHLRRFL